MSGPPSRRYGVWQGTDAVFNLSVSPAYRLVICDGKGTPDLALPVNDVRTIRSVTVYDEIGGMETIRTIVSTFYAGVAEDDSLRALYPEADLGPAEERLTLFLAQYWGGPTTYPHYAWGWAWAGNAPRTSRPASRGPASSPRAGAGWRST